MAQAGLALSGESDTLDGARMACRLLVVTMSWVKASTVTLAEKAVKTAVVGTFARVISLATTAGGSGDGGDGSTTTNGGEGGDRCKNTGCSNSPCVGPRLLRKIDRSALRRGFPLQ